MEKGHTVQLSSSLDIATLPTSQYSTTAAITPNSLPEVNTLTIAIPHENYSNSTSPTPATDSNKKKSTTFSNSHHQHHHTHHDKAHEDNKSSTSSSSSKTVKKISVSKGALRMDLSCCNIGLLDLSWVRIFAIIAMIVNTLTFLILLGLIIFNQQAQTSTNVDVLALRGNIYLYAAWINAYSMVAAYSQNTSYLSYYYKYTNQVDSLTSNLLSQISDQNVRNEYINNGAIMYAKMKEYNSNAAVMMENGNFAKAIELYKSFEFTNARDVFRVEQDKLMTYVTDTQTRNNYLAFVASTTSLVIISVAVVVTLPIILFVFGFAIKKDAINNRNLKRAQAMELMDVMNNDKLRILFQKHCKKEFNSENFEFLEHVQIYRRMCEHQIELVQMLSDGESSASSITNSSVPSSLSGAHGSENHSNSNIEMNEQSSRSKSSNDKTTSSEKKKKTGPPKTISEMENELDTIEVKKSQLASEIYLTFLDVTGAKAVNVNTSSIESVKMELDAYSNHQIHSLSEDLFDYLEKEISIVMLDTHMRFKQSMEFLKEMRIKKIKDIGTKKSQQKRGISVSPTTTTNQTSKK
ncbi:hypothetical protein NAEGRDRAFT_57445 [Naegleria gruberi]|uniref:RGS domain-containing protein n=1 Tax=Naegleria gruberi TaxID=5762 RepID=D2V8A4_NAEGR|nr:uncharacterized protein NAEGRDRAFT_57445 [Naegleria gruberi]EFC47143.1 hypothetical protein NAEGRDRAFT_57445 [Naegleria gruberi]|eukprot:XP_002679887.1 hypothetical protein NAEGRDRAFT_57445 [Naegleria gruberi strain NEG-M]